MKIDYDRYLELNKDCCDTHGNQLNAFWIIQMGVEKLLNGDNIEPIHKKLLLDLGVITDVDTDETVIVKPHKFAANGW